MKYGCFLIAIIGFSVLSACNQEVPEDPIPYVLVNEQINLNSLLYEELRLIGGTAYLEDAGVKGIVIYRASQDEYRAYDRACSFRPSMECERVAVDDSGLFLVDTCCGSNFDFYGFPSAGPARFPLREYLTYVSGSTLVIRNR